MKTDQISNAIQLDSSGRLIHLLGLEGLSKKHLTNILDVADSLIDSNGKLKKSKVLDNMSIANLFFEPSTRTRNTFEIAAKRTSANVINVDLENSATKKNESIIDTMRTLEAMQIDMFVIRHKQNGLPHMVAESIGNVSILNAGDGINAHPTQALLDMLSIRQHKKDFKKLSVAIVGDIVHSRVAHSDIQALKTLGTTDIRLIAPPPLQYDAEKCVAINCYDNIEEGIEDCDVVMMLRLQKERMLEAEIPNEQEYFDRYGLSTGRLSLAKPDAIVMHPGPINRGVEIESSVADGTNSIILKQVTNGIAVRMAVMEILARKD
ncbi:MAG: aspartate carbamoyltransferase catalytic subunit [Candidatus Thioglobus sp.]